MLTTLLFLFFIPLLTVFFLHHNHQRQVAQKQKNEKIIAADVKKFETEVMQYFDENKKEETKNNKKTKATTPPPQKQKEERQQQQQQRQRQQQNEDQKEYVNGTAAVTPSSLSAPPQHQQHAPHPPSILIAYATYSQNTLQLAHKLYSQLQTFFYEKKQQHDEMDKAYVVPKIKILELREEEMASVVDEGSEGATTSNLQNNKNKKGKKMPIQRSCTVDTILYDANYYLTIILTSTFSEGRAPPRSQSFELLLQDAVEDHRIDRNILQHKKFCLFSLGDIHYGAPVFNLFGKNVCRQLKQLGAPAFVVPPVFSTEEKMNLLFKIFCEGLMKYLGKVEFIRKEHYEALLDNFYNNNNNNNNGEEGEEEETVKNVTRDGGLQQDYLPALYDMKVHKIVLNSKNKTVSKKPTTTATSGSNNLYCCSSSSSNNNNKVTADDDDNNNDDDGEASKCCCHNKQNNDNDNDNKENDEEEEQEEEEDEEADEEEDVEDLLNTNDEDDEGHTATAAPREPRPLLYPRLQKNLEKQGYKIIGTHSAVKLCRWTKNMLRGRGGCYKYSFYNIKSYQCMEATPSLACANKCIFCWRHHTNPVAKKFLWKQESPEFIISEGLAAHQQMIKQMRGVPGVTAENLAAGMNVRHCALSLVGEPIMYPQINHFVELLHQRHISSFMVTNAQFPDEIARLRPVVQLYLSIDAPNAVLLKEIDRPLFEDHWERCLRSIDALAKKKNTRTVFRLTIMNERNDAHIGEYVNLIQRGWPDFIEVKGVTYCGTSNSNNIDMKKNVPQHQQVIGFCEALCAELARRYPHYQTPQMDIEEGNDEDSAHHHHHGAAAPVDENEIIVIPPEERNRPYHVACEHEHSCCVLIAHDKFYFNKRWNTWIDYAKFFELVNDNNNKNDSGSEDAERDNKAAAAVEEVDVFNNNQNEKEHNKRYTFTSLDYTAPTAKWATYRSQERGFDPKQTRVIRNKARPTVTATTTSTTL